MWQVQRKNGYGIQCFGELGIFVSPCFSCQSVRVVAEISSSSRCIGPFDFPGDFGDWNASKLSNTYHFLSSLSITKGGMGNQGRSGGSLVSALSLFFFLVLTKLVTCLTS